MYIYKVMMRDRIGNLFLYLILAGVILAFPAVVFISSRTLISLNDLFNIYAIILLVSAIQYRWVARLTGNRIISVLYLIFGSSLLLMALFLSLNYFVPGGGERNEHHKIETVDYNAGNIILTFTDSAFADDPGMRRFEYSELEKAPKKMTVRYTTREGLFGYRVLLERSVN